MQFSQKKVYSAVLTLPPRAPHALVVGTSAFDFKLCRMNNFLLTHVCASTVIQRDLTGEIPLPYVKFRNHVLWSQLQNKCGVCSRSAIGKL